MRLHGRIYLHSLAVLVIACAATAATFAFGMRAVVMEDVGRRVGRHLASLVGDVVDEPGALNKRLAQIHDDLGVSVTVRRPDGHVIAAVREPRSGPGWWVTAPIRATASGENVGMLEAFFPRPFASPHILRPGLMAAVILIVVALVTIPTARRISRPLERLTSAVRRLGSGDLSARVPLVARTQPWWTRQRRHHGDELAELTRAFNEMADRVEQLVRGQRELLTNVSHELRSPLTRIRMALELLPADAASEARVRGLEADLSDLERLIDDVLTAARLDQTGLPTRLDALDARELLADVAARARHDPLIEGKELRVDDGPAVPLTADGALLRRAVWNLVENAAKYGAPPITLGAERIGDRIALSVSDQGSGISSAERERVFTPFYRGDRARTPDGTRGVGLGLTIARRVAEVHGGRIAIEAASTTGEEHHGCRVVITLPVDQTLP